MRDIGKAFHRQRTARQVIEAEVDHIQRGIDLVDTHLQARNDVAALFAVNRHRQQTVADKRMVGAGVASVAAGADHRTDVAEITGDLRVEAAYPHGTLRHIRRAEQHIDQLLHVAAHLLRQRSCLDHVLFQQVAADATNQVHPVGFTRPGEDLRHLH